MIPALAPENYGWPKSDVMLTWPAEVYTSSIATNYQKPFLTWRLHSHLKELKLEGQTGSRKDKRVCPVYRPYEENEVASTLTATDALVHQCESFCNSWPFYACLIMVLVLGLLFSSRCGHGSSPQKNIVIITASDELCFGIRLHVI